MCLEINNCSCGRAHYCAVEQVLTGNGVAKEADKLLVGLKNAVVVADENTMAAFTAAGGNLKASNVTEVIFPGEPVLVPDETAIAKIEDNLCAETEAVVGIGGGTVNDLCKYVAFKHGLRYIYVATAPSMDGYASDGAALILEGMKATVKTCPPRVIICDTEILQNAPIELIRAGIGDILGKFSCLNDWLLASFVKGEYFCREIYDRVYAYAVKVADNIGAILSREGNAISLLTEALLYVGVEMSYAGSSRPASGSEHHMAHFFEIQALENGRKHQPHGVDVGCASYYTALLREKIIQSELAPSFSFEAEEYYNHLSDLLPRAIGGIKELQIKTALHGNGTGNYDMQGIKAVLAKAPSAAEMRRLLSAAGLPPEQLESFYGRELVADAIKYGKELKDRFTVLWLYEYLGWENFEI